MEEELKCKTSFYIYQSLKEDREIVKMFRESALPYLLERDTCHHQPFMAVF